MSDLSYTIYPPDCAANNRPDKFKAEIRHRGWLIDWQLFDTKPDAEQWGKNHPGEVSPKASELFGKMIRRWHNK